MTDEYAKTRIDLRTTQVAAGSFASVTSAVAASQLGVAGTLVGAGVGSVVGTVAGAVYEHYLDRTHHRVRALVPARRSRDSPDTEPAATAVLDGIGEQDTGPIPLPSTDPALAGALPAVAPDEAQEQSTWRWLRSRRLAVALSAAAGLGIGLVALTTFEALTGGPVSQTGTDDGGTSIGQVLGGGGVGDPATDATTSPSSEASTTEGSTPGPSVPVETSPGPVDSSPTEPATTTSPPSAEPVIPAEPPNGG